MDIPFLMFLALTILIMGAVFATGFYTGQHRAYMDLYIADLKDRNERNRQELERLKNNDRDHPDSNQG